MILLASFVVTVLLLLVLLLVVYAMYMPQAQIQRRMSKMIAEAEYERQAIKQSRNKSAAQGIYRTLADMSFRERIIDPLRESIEQSLVRLAPRELRNMMEKMIFHLGVQESWSVNRLAAGWVISVVVGLLLALLMVWNSSLQIPQKMAILLLGAAGGALLPFMVLQSAIRRRQAALRRQLPEFLDMLCVSVQAGLSFDGALAKIVARMKGPVVDEFSRALRDMEFGMTRQHTLTQLANRCDLEEMYLFTSSVIQSEHLGTSMSKTLKQQADNMRDRHRQWVRAEAMRAPVKIIFPLVFFIFPSIFVMVIFPAALSLLKNLSK